MGSTPSWAKPARRQQTFRRVGFFAAVVGLFVVWFGLTGLAWWLWFAIFGRHPSDALGLAVFGGLEAVLFAGFLRFGPTLPFRGKAPEEAAAEAFLAKSEVRSDDNRFERDLKP